MKNIIHDMTKLHIKNFKYLKFIVTILISLSTFQVFSSLNSDKAIDEENNSQIYYTGFQGIPNEVVQIIFSNFTLKDLKNVSQISKSFNDNALVVGDTNSFYKKRAQEKYPLVFKWLDNIQDNYIKDAIGFHMNLVYLVVDINNFNVKENELPLYNNIKFNAAFNEKLEGIYTAESKKLPKREALARLQSKVNTEQNCSDLRKLLIMSANKTLKFNGSHNQIANIITAMATLGQREGLEMQAIGLYHGWYGFEENKDKADEILKNINTNIKDVLEFENRAIYTWKRTKTKSPFEKNKFKRVTAKDLECNSIVQNWFSKPDDGRKIMKTKALHLFGNTEEYVPKEWFKN